MGAISFVHTVNSTSAREGFDSLVEEAIEEHGNSCYNGTISTCSLGRIEKMANVYSEDVGEKARLKIERDGHGEKWVAKCLDLGIVGYYNTIVTKETINKGKPKWVMKYVAKWQNPWTDESGEKIFDNKTEANKFAIEQTLKDPLKEYIVVKMPVNVGNTGSEEVTKIRTFTTKTSSKPVKAKKGHQSIREIHRYMYYGWAAE